MIVEIIKLSEALKKTVDKVTGVVTLYYPDDRVVKISAPEILILGEIITDLVPAKRNCVPKSVIEKIKETFVVE